MPVHPYAAAFPMMSDDELDALADDIKANGLQRPIVYAADGRLIDGRNRLAACERAGVEPRNEVLPANVDPVAYITSANVKRRNMTKGQTAIVAVRAFSDSENQTDIAHAIGVTPGRVGEAATILEFAPDLADEIIAGARAFDAAYDEARQRKRARESDAAKLAALHDRAPDFAEFRGFHFDERTASPMRTPCGERERKRTVDRLRDACVLRWTASSRCSFRSTPSRPSSPAYGPTGSTSTTTTSTASATR